VKLLVLDIEGTLFQTDIRLPGTSIDSTIWQAIAGALGPDAVREEVETHRRWEKKGYRSYLDWMKDTISIHCRYGLSRELFERLISSAKYNPGVAETLLALDRTEYEPVLISGGFRELAARAQRHFNIHHAFAACEYFFGEKGTLQSYNLLPCDFEGKIDFIKLMLQEYGLTSEDWVFVGDGVNDVPVARAAPVSIGYRPHPELKRIVTYAIDEFQ
jgi:phosphoserine phosphatase